MLGRQLGTGGSDEGTGEIPGVPDESIFAYAKDDNEETESDSDDIYKYRINVRKKADTQMKAAEKIADITKETTEQPLTSSSFSVPSDYGNQFRNLSHNKEIFEQHPLKGDEWSDFWDDSWSFSDDDDDEGPTAGSNQGKSTKRRRTRESESAKKPSTTKEFSK
ncbi:hypothetical protein Tco_0785809, partial [Tanacetum coccineum]